MGLSFLVDFAGSGILLILLTSTGLGIVSFEITMKVMDKWQAI
jgi:hypothetical protein